MSEVPIDYLVRFGAVTHYYAAAEMNIKIALASMMRIDVADMMVLCEPYGSLQLRNVAKSLVKLRNPLPPDGEEFLQLVGDWGAFGAIRNNIAHNIWAAGSTAGSIRPVRMDIREGKARPSGFGDNEAEYSVADFSKIAIDLAALNKRMVAFLRRVYPDAASMAANEDESSLSIS